MDRLYIIHELMYTVNFCITARMHPDERDGKIYILKPNVHSGAFWSYKLLIYKGRFRPKSLEYGVRFELTALLVCNQFPWAARAPVRQPN